MAAAGMAGDARPLPHCARCGAALLVCSCKAVPSGRDVVFPFTKLPEDATPQQRLERWRLHVAMNPATGHFDAGRFVDIVLARGLLPCFERLRPRLEAMTAHYCQDSTELGYRHVYGLLTAKAPTAKAQYSPGQCRKEVQLAVQRFLSFDWSRMSLWDVAVVNNVYQASDPIAYPITDPDLSFGYEVVDCLMLLMQQASERLSYSFEPFDWQ